MRGKVPQQDKWPLLLRKLTIGRLANRGLTSFVKEARCLSPSQKCKSTKLICIVIFMLRTTLKATVVTLIPRNTSNYTERHLIYLISHLIIAIFISWYLFITHGFKWCTCTKIFHRSKSTHYEYNLQFTRSHGLLISRGLNFCQLRKNNREKNYFHNCENPQISSDDTYNVQAPCIS